MMIPVYETEPRIYAELDQPIDFKMIEVRFHELRRLRVLIAVGSIASFCIVLAALFLYETLGFAYVIIILASLAGFCVLLMYVKGKTLNNVRVHKELFIIIKEEWKTGKSIIPDWFDIPKRYEMMRRLPSLTSSQRRRLAAANRIGSGGLVGILAAGAMGSFLLAAALAWANAPIPVTLAVSLVPLAAVIGFAIWATSGFSLRWLMQEYESATGKMTPSAMTQR